MKHLVTKTNPGLHGEDKTVEFDSMLQAADGSGIFTVEKSEYGFLVAENCDSWHAMILTPDQLRLLGEELIEMSKT